MSVTLCCLLRKPEVLGVDTDPACLKLQKTVLASSSMGFHTELGVRLTRVQI